MKITPSNENAIIKAQIKLMKRGSRRTSIRPQTSKQGQSHER